MRAGSCIALVGLLLAGGLLAAVPAPSASAPSPPTPMQWESHAPILIDGNAAFTDPASGVRSGRGTANDPYVIEQWDVDASSATGVEIRNTDAYFILREVFVHDGGDSHVGVMLYNLQNGWVESVSSNGNLIGFHVELAAATTLNAVNAWDNVVEGVKVLGGSDVVLTQITAERDFDGIFVDGVTRLDVTLSYARDNRWRGFVLAYSSGVTADMNNATGNAGVGMFLWQNTDLALTNTWLGGNGLSAAHLQSFTIADTTVLQGGMELFDVSQGVVRDNVIDRPGYMGIRLGGSNVTLARNSVSRAPDAAIRIEGSADISLDANRIFDTPLGLYAVGTRRLTMTGNRFNGTGVYLSGDTIDDFASHAIATDNLVDGLPIRYVARCADVTLDGVAAGQVIAADCDRLRLANLSLGPTERGVQLFFVRTAEVSNVSVRDTRQDGIVVQDAQDVRIADVSVVRAGPYAWGVLAVSVARMTIERATIDGAGYGLSAAPASVVTIRDSVVDGVEIGILVSGGDFVLERNRIADSLHGFRLDVAQRATIRDNVIERSSSSPDTSGIELLGGTDIVLTGNRVADADTGTAGTTATRMEGMCGPITAAGTIAKGPPRTTAPPATGSGTSRTSSTGTARTATRSSRSGCRTNCRWPPSVRSRRNP